MTTSECKRSNLAKKELPVMQVYTDWSNERETQAPAIFKKLCTQPVHGFHVMSHSGTVAICSTELQHAVYLLCCWL